MPTQITNAGDNSSRLFIVEQTGRVRVVKNGRIKLTVFLDIARKVTCCGEQGLFSIAFPPGYATKKRFYASYTDVAGNSTLSMFQIGPDDVADPNSEVVILTVPHPLPNHYGGMIAFGPDGYLYVALGDGGGGGDPSGNAQNPDSLLGKLLRIDVESVPGRYFVPDTNPFVGNPLFRPEIWALGFRNPWKFSFDRRTGELYIGDVGESQYEEVNYEAAGSPGGQNFGWNSMEGMHCYALQTCSNAGLTLPITEYTHQTDCAVTGGFVDRGSGDTPQPAIYLYGDFCSGIIRGLSYDGTGWHSTVLTDTDFHITTFGDDESGNVYVADYYPGAIYRIARTNR
jgi:glucose/arabinose dehydrogenase